MMRKTAVPFLAILCLCSLLAAQDQPVAVTDVAVDKLLEGVRVTIACSGSPNVSSYVSNDPPAVIVDLMGATSRLKQDRVESSYYPVSAVSVQPSEATEGLRITVRLRDMVDHKVTTENGVVSIDLGTAPMSPPAPPQQKDVFAGKRLTLYVKDADLVDIIRMISSQFGINILTTQDVKSIITVRLSDVTLRAGLDALLKAGLCNMVEGAEGIIVVKPVKKDMYGEFETRVYELDHTEALDIVKVIPKVLSPGGNVELGYRRVGNAGGSDRNNVVVVTDIPEAHERVAQFIADIDRPYPQVYIEAKFVETTLTSEDIYGIQWNLSAAAGSGNFNWGKDFGVPIVFNNMVLGKLDLSNFNATMDILQTRGKSRVLANPSTLTLDNHTATVSMGTDIPQREISTDPKTGLVLYTWRTRSVPISLEVTPHVTSDGKISMRVKPSVEAITGYTGPADDQRPIVARRSAESNIIVGDGEVAVIGGLIRDEETRNIGKVPLLGDIPILGNLFKKTSIRHTKNDLMIFIIPHILPAEG
jgi:type IV pilus assembly protein PilQ